MALIRNQLNVTFGSSKLEVLIEIQIDLLLSLLFFFYLILLFYWKFPENFLLIFQSL